MYFKKMFANTLKMKNKIQILHHCRLFSDSRLKNILQLKERGMFQEIFPDTSEKSIKYFCEKSPQSVYAGFDPTADSLHVGNLLVIMNLLHWQRGGHKVFAVLGGATGLIGDPSHRKNEREEMDQKTINENINYIKENILTVFENHNKYFWKDKNYSLSPVTFINNIEWYQNFNVIDFVRNIGKHFRLGTMLIKSSVQSRLNSDTGMSYTEFTYQVFQAYDWLCLLKKYDCRFQIGGSDQLGNITAGHELISRTEKKDVYGITLPLITAEGGKKFGKSLGNAVWLSSKKSSSFQLYQYFIRTEDVDVEKFLKLFTFLSLTEIEEIMNLHTKEPEKHIAQKILAENVTLLVHGEEELKLAKNASALLYEGSIDSLAVLNQNDVLNIFQGARVIDLPAEPETTAYELALKAKCFKSEKDASRIISAGGFYINYNKVYDQNQVISQENYILPNKITLLRTGKKTYHIVRWIP